MPDNTAAREQAEAIRASTTRRPRPAFDIGCGRDEVAATLAHLGIPAVAMDLSAAAGGQVGQAASKFYGISGGVEFVGATGLAALPRRESPDTAIFCESVEHIPPGELYETFGWMKQGAGSADGGMRAVITNRADFRPVRAEPGDWDHVHDVDDELYDRLASAAKRTVVRHGSRLVLDCH